MSMDLTIGCRTGCGRIARTRGLCCVCYRKRNQAHIKKHLLPAKANTHGGNSRPRKKRLHAKEVKL